MDSNCLAAAVGRRLATDRLCSKSKNTVGYFDVRGVHACGAIMVCSPRIKIVEAGTEGGLGVEAGCGNHG